MRGSELTCALASPIPYCLEGLWSTESPWFASICFIGTAQPDFVLWKPLSHLGSCGCKTFSENSSCIPSSSCPASTHPAFEVSSNLLGCCHCKTSYCLSFSCTFIIEDGSSGLPPLNPPHKEVLPCPNLPCKEALLVLCQHGMPKGIQRPQPQGGINNNVKSKTHHWCSFGSGIIVSGSSHLRRFIIWYYHGQ